MKVDVILSDVLITEAVEKKRKEMWEKKRNLNRKNSLSSLTFFIFF